VVTYFDQLLNIPTISVPLANDDCAMHAVDENFNLDNIEKGINFSRIFFSKN
jgi:acetylornithine deacetylase/succinyl-diaminopimelate desuccinylase-like protein